MKKVLALTLSAGLASVVASPSVGATTYLDYVSVYGSATYTKPSNNGLSVGAIATFFPPSSGYAFSRSLFLAPEFDWDYNVGASFRFPCTEARLFATYDHYNGNDARFANGVANGLLQNAIIVIPDDGDGPHVTAMNATVKETAHEWRLGVSYLVPVSCRFWVDFSGFFEYNRVSISMHEWLSASNLEGDISGLEAVKTYFESNSKLRGWGPGFGFKLNGIPFANCPTFNVFAGVMTSLFYGKNSYDAFENLDLEFALTSINPLQGVYFASTPENSHSILAKVDIKFGIDYARQVCLFSGKYDAGITVGARYMNIFNAFKNGNVSQNLSLQVRDSTRLPALLPIWGVPDDWGRVGPYIQFRLGGCNA